MRARLTLALALPAALVCLGALAPSAPALAPTVTATYSAEVSARTASLRAAVNPGGKASTYRFDYITKAAYEANLAAAKDPFAGALKLPAGAEGKVSGTLPTTIGSPLFGLEPETAYRYRLSVKNLDGQGAGAVTELLTHPQGAPLLAEGRGWEMVSPVDKNGGEVSAPGTLLGGAVLQGAAQGGAVTYSSPASFGSGAQGAAPVSQYIARRSAAGWSTENIAPAALAGSYGTAPGGVPYRLFSGDLARALMLNGEPCRGEGGGCPVPNPPLAGTGAPPGYQNYYLRESATGAFEALLDPGDVLATALGPAELELRLAGASPDLRHLVLSSCAALAPGASEVPLLGGCDPTQPNLYKWSAGALTAINATPGAALAAPAGAVSADGSRVYWIEGASGDLYLREGGSIKQVDAAAGGGGSFETASADGATALFTAAGHLYRYSALADAAADLTPGGGVLGVLGASADASHVYYLTAAGVFLREGAATTKVAAAADAANHPPATGTARISADGTKLLFLASAPLLTAEGSAYDNTDLLSGNPDSQVYLYDDAGAGTLTCVSCNPTHARPLGPSWVPGAIANGQGPLATHTHKPRVLSADGRRVFFESLDALALNDTNLNSKTGAGVADVYQWRSQGTGGCAIPRGCVSLISGGRSEAVETSSGFLDAGASFVDASAEGTDAFFLTDVSLLGEDPGAIDLYDARLGGGFPPAPEPFPCEGDSCQIVPSEPQDPTLTTVLAGPGNPTVRYRNYKPKGKKCRAAKAKQGKCKKAKGKAAKRAKRGGRR